MKMEGPAGKELEVLGGGGGGGYIFVAHEEMVQWRD